MLTHERTRNHLLEVEVITDPATLLVSVDDMKDYLNVTKADQDTLIESMIKAAVRTCEEYTLRTFITHNVRTQWLGTNLPMRIFRPPIQSIVSVTTYFEGTPTIEDETDFYMIAADGMRPRVHMKSDGEWAANDIEVVSFVCKCGYGDDAADVPDPIIDAVRWTVSNMFDNPDDFVKQGANLIPVEAQSALNPFVCPTR